jgi:hypothetical protein
VTRRAYDCTLEQQQPIDWEQEEVQEEEEQVEVTRCRTLRHSRELDLAGRSEDTKREEQQQNLRR